MKNIIFYYVVKGINNNTKQRAFYDKLQGYNDSKITEDELNSFMYPVAITDFDVETIFFLLNSIDNPLYSDKGREIVKKNVGHTSMSVGDMVYDIEKCKCLVCDIEGWKTLEWAPKLDDNILDRFAGKNNFIEVI